MSDFETVIIGAGLIGSAAARHAARSGADVAVVGPSEPTTSQDHAGPFASHYDSGRITRHLDASPVWAELAARAIAEYSSIATSSGIGFHHPVGVLWADRGPGGLEDLAASSERYGIPLRPLTRDEAADGLFWSFPSCHALGYEPAPAGFIDPRCMVRAQLAAAEAAGAAVVNDVVDRVTATGSGVELALRSGGRLTASQAIVAAGAYSGFLVHELADVPIEPITAAVVLGRISDEDAEALEGMPAMIHRIGDGDYVDVYAVPPVRYPDGAWYIKLGVEVLPEVVLGSGAAVTRWMTGSADEWAVRLEESLRSLLPNTHFLTTTVKPCMYARTPSRFPYIDRVADDIVVAAGGNGRAAKSADAIGALAVDLTQAGEWNDELDHRWFQIPG